MLRKKPFLISAVKTSVGHTESAAGLTGLLRVIGENAVAKNLHFKTLNPFIGSLLLENMSAVFPLEVKNSLSFCHMSFTEIFFFVFLRRLQLQVELLRAESALLGSVGPTRMLL